MGVPLSEGAIRRRATLHWQELHIARVILDGLHGMGLAVGLWNVCDLSASTSRRRHCGIVAWLVVVPEAGRNTTLRLESQATFTAWQGLEVGPFPSTYIHSSVECHRGHHRHHHLGHHRQGLAWQTKECRRSGARNRVSENSKLPRILVGEKKKKQIRLRRGHIGFLRAPKKRIRPASAPMGLKQGARVQLQENPIRSSTDAGVKDP